MRANGWQKPPEISSPSVVDGRVKGTSLTRRAAPKTQPAAPSPASILAAQKREEQRKHLAELKRQFKLQQQEKNESSDTVLH